jgi:hypothetical protein
MRYLSLDTQIQNPRTSNDTKYMLNEDCKASGTTNVNFLHAELSAVGLHEYVPLLATDAYGKY